MKKGLFFGLILIITILLFPSCENEETWDEDFIIEVMNVQGYSKQQKIEKELLTEKFKINLDKSSKKRTAYINYKDNLLRSADFYNKYSSRED